MMYRVRANVIGGDVLRRTVNTKGPALANEPLVARSDDVATPWDRATPVQVATGLENLFTDDTGDKGKTHKEQEAKTKKREGQKVDKGHTNAADAEADNEDAAEHEASNGPKFVIEPLLHCGSLVGRRSGELGPFARLQLLGFTEVPRFAVGFLVTR